ncbi:hypothetical protein NSE01_15040 [Novosphingobium sediminis]|uniref:Uncharacterized protein n=1 Tax=Novosphingobium sediminis TaxID=707214 RepID=A0A512AJ09_9SPHN|nr:hypothetical protein NSE01_15040 [Novosphingobium sediminis]
MFAQRDGRETLWLGIGHTAAHGCHDGGIERVVGESGEFAHDPGKRERAGEISDGKGNRQGKSPAAQGHARVRFVRTGLMRIGQSVFDPSLAEHGFEIRQPVEPSGEKGRFGAGAVEGVCPVRGLAHAGHGAAMPGWRQAIKHACAACMEAGALPPVRAMPDAASRLE